MANSDFQSSYMEVARLK